MQEETVVFWIFSFVIAGGVVVIVSAMKYRAKVLEMAHRERLAMIERGLVPPALPEPQRSPRKGLRIGVLLVGLGLGVGLLSALGLASEGESMLPGIGAGGLVLLIGAAFVVNGVIELRAAERAAPKSNPADVAESST